MNDVRNYDVEIFENIKHVNEYGQEFWYARELQHVLEYSEWRNFVKVIDRAKIACRNAGSVENHYFVESNKIVKTGISEKQIVDYKLARYACYLIVQNGDPNKEVIALGQTYFAIKTRQQELIENYQELSEDEKRIAIRRQVTEHNKSLVEAAKSAGIITPMEYATFQNRGYQGLYGGLTAQQIHQLKGLKKSQKILDFMGSEELAANLFRATQTDAKLRRENIMGKEKANETHYQVGKAVRNTIKELGGTMPEDLPTPRKSVKQIEREQKKLTSKD